MSLSKSLDRAIREENAKAAEYAAADALVAEQWAEMQAQGRILPSGRILPDRVIVGIDPYVALLDRLRSAR